MNKLLALSPLFLAALTGCDKPAAPPAQPGGQMAAPAPAPAPAEPAKDAAPMAPAPDASKDAKK